MSLLERILERMVLQHGLHKNQCIQLRDGLNTIKNVIFRYFHVARAIFFLTGQGEVSTFCYPSVNLQSAISRIQTFQSLAPTGEMKESTRSLEIHFTN